MKILKVEDCLEMSGDSTRISSDGWAEPVFKIESMPVLEIPDKVRTTYKLEVFSTAVSPSSRTPEARRDAAFAIHQELYGAIFLKVEKALFKCRSAEKWAVEEILEELANELNPQRIYQR